MVVALVVVSALHADERPVAASGHDLQAWQPCVGEEGFLGSLVEEGVKKADEDKLTTECGIVAALVV